MWASSILLDGWIWEGGIAGETQEVGGPHGASRKRTTTKVVVPFRHFSFPCPPLTTSEQREVPATGVVTPHDVDASPPRCKTVNTLQLGHPATAKAAHHHTKRPTPELVTPRGQGQTPTTETPNTGVRRRGYATPRRQREEKTEAGS